MTNTNTKDTFKGYQASIEMNLNVAKSYLKNEIENIYDDAKTLFDNSDRLIEYSSIEGIRMKLKIIANDIRDAERDLARLQELEGKAEVMKAVLKEVE